MLPQETLDSNFSHDAKRINVASSFHSRLAKQMSRSAGRRSEPQTPNNPLHTEPRAARLGEINVVRRGPVNGAVPNPLMPPARSYAAKNFDGHANRCLSGQANLYRCRQVECARRSVVTLVVVLPSCVNWNHQGAAVACRRYLTQDKTS